MRALNNRPASLHPIAKMLNRLVQYFLVNRLITLLLLLVFITGGIITAPFNWNVAFLPRNPVPVDAIPDLGENQQIIATEWMGRSPKDMQDQVTYPLSTALLGIPGVQTIRSTSMFGMSFIYIIFKDQVDFYWSRRRSGCRNEGNVRFVQWI